MNLSTRPRSGNARSGLHGTGPRPRPALVAALCCLGAALLLGACRSSAATDDRASDDLPSRSRAARALLTADDVAGYQRTEPENLYPDRSDRPRCLDTLNDLDGGTPAAGTATQGRIDYARSQTGPWLRETLRVHRNEKAAEDAYRKAVTALSACEKFTVSWSKDGNSGTESVREIDGPTLGDRSWTARVQFAGTAFQSTETKILVQKGRLFIVIAHAATPDAPPATETGAIARRAVERAVGELPR